MAESDKEKSFRERVEEALASGLPIPDFPQTTALSDLATAYNEAVSEFEKTGFTRNEALYLVSAMFNSNPGLGPCH